MTVTIDGPAGAGKSTTARLVATRLGFTYFDTGAMYRAITLLALERGISLQEGEALADLAKKTQLRIESTAAQTRIWVDGREITEAIRSPEVSRSVSEVAAHPLVRNEMVRLQRLLASQGDCVVEGRDIGTVVFPQAEVKIFMNASIDERARRRLEELRAGGVQANLEEIRAEIEARDRLDSARETAPLQKAVDAIEIDTTHLTIEEQVQKIVDIVRQARQ